MKTFKEAVEVLKGRRTRKLENNTYLEQRDAETIAVRLHATDVVTYKADGKVILNSGGWHTKTTADRLTKYSPLTVIQRNFYWYVVKPGQWDETKKIEYRDGMSINGEVLEVPR